MSSQDSTPPASVQGNPGTPVPGSANDLEMLMNRQVTFCFADGFEFPDFDPPVAAPAPVDDALVAQPAPLAQAVPMDDANHPPVPKSYGLHRTGRRKTCTCGKQTDNDCGTCSECRCPPNCRNTGGHLEQ
jgi:hypothetical protein